MSDGSAILLAIAGTAAAAVADWYFSHKSGSNLDAVSRRLAANDQELLRTLSVLARLMEHAGIGKGAYNADGILTGIVVTGTGNISLSGLRAAGRGTCTPPPQYDRQHEQPPIDDPEAHRA